MPTTLILESAEPETLRLSDCKGSVSIVSSKTKVVEMGFLLLFGFVFRLIAMLLVIKQHPPMWLFTRGTEMGLMATSILNGEGLSSPFGGHTGSTALIGPLYPIMVAAIFRLAGSYTLASEIIILTIQVLVGVLNIWLVVRLTQSLAGQQAAFFAGLFWACSPPLLFMPTIFWDTTFTACALTAMSLLAFEFSEGPSRKRLLYASVLFSLASLLNSALFFTSVALLVLLSAQLPAARLKSFLLALVVFSITFSPWPIRNAFVMRAFIPFRTTVGLELWMGNHEGATGHLEETLFPLFNAQELAEYKRLGEVGYNHEKAHLALNYIYSEPAAFIRLTLARIARYWLGTGSRDESKWLAIHGILTTAFGFAGIAFFVWKRSTKSVLPFVIPLVMFPLPYYITHAEFRYRLVVDPLMTAFAACAVLLFIQEANKQLSNRSPRAFGATAPMGSRLSNPKMVQLTASNDRERAS